MELSPNEKKKIQFFSALSEYTQSLEYFAKKRWGSEVISFWNIDCKKRGYLNAEKAPS